MGGQRHVPGSLNAKAQDGGWLAGISGVHDAKGSFRGERMRGVVPDGTGKAEKC